MTKSDTSELNDESNVNKEDTNDDFLSVVDAINKKLDSTSECPDEINEKRISKRERRHLINDTNESKRQKLAKVIDYATIVDID